MKNINYLSDKTGLTLVESLISIILVGTLISGILGAFSISKISVVRTRHRITAMNTVKNYMEREIEAGYLGGYVDGDFYMTASSANPVSTTIDDRGTADASDDLIGTIRPLPYPAVIINAGTVYYKAVGFVAEWTEDSYGGGSAPSCSEKAVTYVAEHS